MEEKKECFLNISKLFLFYLWEVICNYTESKGIAASSTRRREREREREGGREGGGREGGRERERIIIIYNHHMLSNTKQIHTIDTAPGLE